MASRRCVNGRGLAIEGYHGLCFILRYLDDIAMADIHDGAEALIILPVTRTHGNKTRVVPRALRFLILSFSCSRLGVIARSFSCEAVVLDRAECSIEITVKPATELLRGRRMEKMTCFVCFRAGFLSQRGGFRGGLKHNAGDDRGANRGVGDRFPETIFHQCFVRTLLQFGAKVVAAPPRGPETRGKSTESQQRCIDTRGHQVGGCKTIK
ncbi:hypothetical protein V8E53_003370 [Lactarius tabidus]